MLPRQDTGLGKEDKLLLSGQLGGQGRRRCKAVRSLHQTSTDA